MCTHGHNEYEPCDICDKVAIPKLPQEPEKGNVGPEGYVTEERARWRSIGTAPKDDVPIITASVLRGKIVRVRMGVWNGLGWYEVYSGVGINYVTHWMPLPPVEDEQARIIRGVPSPRGDGDTG